MSRKKLALIVALIVSAGAIASGIVYAQEASTPQTETLRALLNAQAEISQEPSARNFSFFLDGGAFQCAYCTSGMIMSSVALLRQTPNPSPSEIAKSLQGNICRCGTHPRVIEAVTRAAAAGRERSR